MSSKEKARNHYIDELYIEYGSDVEMLNDILLHFEEVLADIAEEEAGLKNDPVLS